MARSGLLSFTSCFRSTRELKLIHYAVADVAASCPSVIARIPPSLSSTTNPCFTATPSGYFQGIFYETYSSATSLQALKNVWLDTTHDSTTNGNDDLTSYQVISCNDNHVYTSYSNNSFEAGMVDVFPFHLGGTSSSTTYLQELVSYGTDTGGNGYFVMYGNDPNKDLVIASKVTTGQYFLWNYHIVFYVVPELSSISEVKSSFQFLYATVACYTSLEEFSKDNAEIGNVSRSNVCHCQRYQERHQRTR